MEIIGLLFGFFFFLDLAMNKVVLEFLVKPLRVLVLVTNSVLDVDGEEDSNSMLLARYCFEVWRNEVESLINSRIKRTSNSKCKDICDFIVESNFLKLNDLLY